MCVCTHALWLSTRTWETLIRSIWQMTKKRKKERKKQTHRNSFFSLFLPPDRIFQNLVGSKSVFRRNLCSSKTLIAFFQALYYWNVRSGCSPLLQRTNGEQAKRLSGLNLRLRVKVTVAWNWTEYSEVMVGMLNIQQLSYCWVKMKRQAQSFARI